jgi:hypothetical protein
MLGRCALRADRVSDLQTVDAFPLCRQPGPPEPLPQMLLILRPPQERGIPQPIDVLGRTSRWIAPPGLAHPLKKQSRTALCVLASPQVGPTVCLRRDHRRSQERLDQDIPRAMLRSVT